MYTIKITVVKCIRTLTNIRQENKAHGIQNKSQHLHVFAPFVPIASYYLYELWKTYIYNQIMEMCLIMQSIMDRGEVISIQHWDIKKVLIQWSWLVACRDCSLSIQCVICQLGRFKLSWLINQLLIQLYFKKRTTLQTSRGGDTCYFVAYAFSLLFSNILVVHMRSPCFLVIVLLFICVLPAF
jgi:hypothetical protein